MVKGSVKELSTTIQGALMGALRMMKTGLKETLRVSPGSYQGTSKMFKGCVKKVSRFFPEKERLFNPICHGPIDS